MERRTTKEKEKERVPNSRFESDAAGGVVQLRKHVKFEMSNFRDEVVCFRSPQSSPQISWKMSNVEFRVVVCYAVAKHRISPAESRWALRREGRSCISIFVSKLFFNSRDEVDVLFCSRFCESIVASIATGSDLLISFCASALRFLKLDIGP